MCLAAGTLVASALVHAQPARATPRTQNLAYARKIRSGPTGQAAVSGLVRIDLSTGEAVQLVHVTGALTGVTWGPKRWRLAFTRTISFLPSGGCTLERIRRDGSAKHVILRSITSCFLGPRWSPDGSRILFHDGENVFTVSPNGEGLQQLTDFHRPLAEISGVAWSPDGRRIAFTRSTPGGGGRLYVAAADGSRQIVIHTCFAELCRGGLRTESPTWSPTGTRIAFTERRNLYLVDPAGGHLARLTSCPATLAYQGCGVMYPTWSPDAGKIAFVTNDRVHIFHLGTGWTRRLAVPGVGSLAWAD